MKSCRTLVCLTIFIVFFLILVDSVAAFSVSYNYRCFASGSEEPTLSEYGTLLGESFFAGDYQRTGHVGNQATIRFHADLSTATLSAFTSSHSVLDGPHIIAGAAANVEKIAFEDELIFTVPAGTYPEGVLVHLFGRVAGTMWSENGSNAQWRCQVSFGSADFAIDLQEIGIGDSGTIAIDESFTITNTLVYPGATLLQAQDFSNRIYAALRRCLSSSPGGASEPGDAEVSFGNGLRLTGLQMPPGVGCVSGSGVFPDLPSPVPEVPDISLRPLLPGNCPNPFNPRTTITYELPAPSGVYLYRLEAAGQVEAKSMTLLK